MCLLRFHHIYNYLDFIHNPLLAEQSKIKTRFSISNILMFSLPSWLARFKLEISCFFPVFKISICEISDLSCFQEILLRIIPYLDILVQIVGNKCYLGFNRNLSLFLNCIHVFVHFNQNLWIGY